MVSGYRARTSSMNAASRSAIAVSWISSTFSAFRSPEREKLNEPTKETSSATTTLACMKSCSDSGVQRVEGFPENGAEVRIVFRSGIFQALTPFVAHWWKTSSTCVSSITPAMSQRFSFTTSTSVARIGPEVRTGEAIRMRLRGAAEELRHPVGERVPVLRREPRSDLDPRVEDHGPGLHAPRVLDPAALPQLVQVERERVGQRRRAQDPHDHVLLAGPRVVGPVRRARPDVGRVADDELVVHQVGNAGNGARRHRQGRDRLELRLGRRGNGNRPRVVDVVEQPDRDAPLLRGEKRREDECAGVGFEAHVVERQVEARAGAPMNAATSRAISAAF